MISPLINQNAWIGGSDAPEKRELSVGFIPLTDCASVIVAAVLGFDEKYGIKILPRKQASWAGIRDKLISGELDAAHALYGLMYGVHMGIGEPKQDMAILMALNNNGQAITLSNQLLARGVTNGEQLQKLIHAAPREHTFAQTFPTGTHAMWLYYWLASYGIDPLQHVRATTVAPPQMVTHMRHGHLHGFCAGEPWNAHAIAEEVGFTAATTQEIWEDHPEKVLGTTAAFADKYPNSARALIMAVLDAARYIDTMANRPKVAGIIADAEYVHARIEVIEQRFLGHYENGLGARWHDSHCVKFFGEGAVSYPWLSDGMWMLTQQRRWGLLKEDPDYLSVAQQVHRLALYEQAASQLGIAVPQHKLRSSKLIDGKVWDGTAPKAYAGSFGVKA